VPRRHRRDGRRGADRRPVGIPLFDLVLSGKKILGSMMGDNRFRIDMPRYCDFYLDGRLRLDEMISARIRLEDVNDSFEKMKAARWRAP
jgi:S-(hydroxymethyl)glutathione dehydrogenase/alcohol dehydrogenase